MLWREPSSSHKLVTVVHVRISAWTSLFRAYIHVYSSISLSRSPKEEQESAEKQNASAQVECHVKGLLAEHEFWDTGTPLSLNGFADVLSPCKTKDLVSVTSLLMSRLYRKSVFHCFSSSLIF